MRSERVQKKKVQAMNEYPAECYAALLVRIGVPTLHMPKKKLRASNFSHICVESEMERGFTTALHTSIDGHGKKIPAK